MPYTIHNGEGIGTNCPHCEEYLLADEIYAACEIDGDENGIGVCPKCRRKIHGYPVDQWIMEDPDAPEMII